MKLLLILVFALTVFAKKSPATRASLISSIIEELAQERLEVSSIDFSPIYKRVKRKNRLKERNTFHAPTVFASNENHIGYRNNLKEQIWVAYDCDKQLMTAESKSDTKSLTAAYTAFKATGTHTTAETQKYMYSMAKKTNHMSKVSPNGGWLQEATPASCKNAGMVYISITNFPQSLKGKPNNFMQASPLNIGWQVKVSGSGKSPTTDKDKKACFGIKCGCKFGHGGDHCWHKCGPARKMKCFSSLKSQDHKYIPCKKDQECRPDWACGDVCTP
jgi:hypothetical protein